MSNLVFLSHIHEERELALAIKEAIEEEFSGFVEIFVSSDGITIPAGSHFLKRIEDGLVNCSAAIYLISPASVNRNWINFELGAVWIRNKINEKNGGPEIPAIPVCHSGMTLSQLPQPINNLNAIQGNVASQLEFAFRGIQTAMNGKGRLKTDFIKLAEEVRFFEKKYTIGDNLRHLFNVINIIPEDFYKALDDNKETSQFIQIDLGVIEQEKVSELRRIETQGLHGVLKVELKIGQIYANQKTGQIGNHIVITIPSDILYAHKEILIGR